MTANMRLMGTAVAIFTLATIQPAAHGQEAREDLTACPGSTPEPTQSGAWSVAFCNRTGHDVVLEFHDNECPAKDWSRRGDVYQRTLRRGESKSFPLCYANEPPGRKPSPGVPTLRIPGGKGVVTTWSVVGDCGERSKPLNLDARTFYDRGEYKNGIILLQYPAGASHCSADGASVANATTPGQTAAAGVAQTAPGQSATKTQGTPVQGSVAAHPTGTGQAAAAQQATGHAPISAQATAAADTASPSAVVHNRGSEPPTLSATVDTKDALTRTVRVFAEGGAGYKCNFNLALTFTDGAIWNDHVKASISPGDSALPIVTRKYLKSVAKAQITSNKCSRE